MNSGTGFTISFQISIRTYATNEIVVSNINTIFDTASKVSPFMLC